MVPQYGHAIAHAIEHLSFHSRGVSPLLHGEAVAIGMAVTAEVGKILGVCDASTVDDHYKYISHAGLPVYIPKGLSIEAIQKKLCYDKHYVKKPSMGLLQEIGHMFCQENGSYAVEVDNDVIEAALMAHMSRRDSCTSRPTDLYTIDAACKVGRHVRTNSPASVADSNDDYYEWDPTTASSFGQICDC
jgi:3-dehydroquinate synthase